MDSSDYSVPKQRSRKWSLTTDAVPEEPRPPPRHSKQYSKNEEKNESKNVFEEDEVPRGWKPEESHARTKNMNACGNLTVIKNSSNIHIGNKLTFYSMRGKKKPAMQSPQPQKPSDNIKRAFLSILPIEINHISQVKTKVGKRWQDLGRLLGYDDIFLEQLENKNPDDVVYKLLLDWIQLNERGATMGILCKSLWEAHELKAAEILAQTLYE